MPARGRFRNLLDLQVLGERAAESYDPQQCLLHHMVRGYRRNLAGCRQGRRPPEWMAEVQCDNDRLLGDGSR